MACDVREASGAGWVVIIADAGGTLPDPRPLLAGQPNLMVIAIGTRSAFGALADMVNCQAVGAVLDADQPFTDLTAALDRLLRTGPPVGLDRQCLVAALRSREAEAQRFTGLTAREQEVLAAVFAGRSATEIAQAERVSMATVRSHLRAVLTKLEVSSQLAAAAMAYRSCREPALVERMRKVHQF